MQTKLIAGALGALLLLAPAGVATLNGQAPAVRNAVVAAPHQRVLPLQGGQNFRDLGGYRTRDRRTVRWGMLYRSGAMNGLTPADYDYLGKLGIRTVCDFRSSEERASAPARWPAAQTPRILADDYHMDMGALDFRAARNWTPEQAKAVMAATYPRTLDGLNSQYRRMFKELLAGNVPLAFNCTAGKDRTGVASALILTALDVPRATVIEDYLLSNRYFDPNRAVMADDAMSRMFQQLPAGVRQAFMGVDRSYIEAVFKVIDAYPGGADAYLRDKLGLGRAELAALRARYTEK